MLRLIKQARLPANRMHQRWMLASMQDLIRPPGGPAVVGELSRTDYQMVTQELRRRGLVRGAVEYDVFVRARRALP